MRKAFEELQIKDDFMFGVIMRNPKFCKPFFVCIFDLFDEGRHIYTFENRCIQNPESGLGDDTTKIILNTKGTMDYMTLQMNYQEKYEQGIEHEKVETARRLIEIGKLSLEDIAAGTELSIEKIKEIAELQPVSV